MRVYATVTVCMSKGRGDFFIHASSNDAVLLFNLFDSVSLEDRLLDILADFERVSMHILHSTFFYSAELLAFTKIMHAG